jgi:7-cyano-7-deazaguanine reductase
MSDKSPLGQKSEYPTSHSPGLLHAISRDDNRRKLGLGADLPFQGEDIWNAYELTWLDHFGKPRVATAEFRVSADSPNIIESKSMKLYLNSLSMTRYRGSEELTVKIAADLSHVAGVTVDVRLDSLDHSRGFGELPGTCIDDLNVVIDSEQVEPELLAYGSDAPASEVLHSHLLRSTCPVTDQPDSGSILIRYNGRRIERDSLLRYLVSYRNHQDFHESCIERIFLDIKRRCEPEQLTVYGRYNRRGGIDINPFRSDFESTIENVRLWRQ